MLENPQSFAKQIQELTNKQCPIITFQITDDCNLQCSYCYQHHKQHHIMAFNIAKDFINNLFNNKYEVYLNINDCGGLVIEFIGGEPFLQVNLMNEILEYFIKQIPQDFQWTCLVSSNGTLINTSQVQTFIKKWFNNLHLVITFDGLKEYHDACRKFPNGEGSYDIVLKAITKYKQLFGTYPDNKITISPDNLQYLAENIKYLIKLGYYNLPVNPTYEGPWDIETAKIYYQQLKEIANFVLENNLENQLMITLFDEHSFHPIPLTNKDNYCGGNGRMLAIDWKGDLYPCLRYMESSTGENHNFIIGNVYDGIIKDCTELKNINRINHSPLKCKLCHVAYGCGNCLAYDYQLSGDFKHRNTEICWMHKARTLANIYYWNTYYRKHNKEDRMLFWLPKKDAIKIIDKEEYKILKNLSYK